MAALLIAVLTSGVVVAASGAGAATDAGTQAALTVDSPSEPTLTVVSTQANETVPHENPDEVGEDGDEERVREYLSSELANRLDDSTVEISEGEYERGRDLLGDDYDELLEQYVTVSGDNDESAETFRELRDEQRSFSDSAEEFEDIRAEYERAVEEGDEERARELARELQRTATELNESATRLDQSYETIETITGTDFSDSRNRTTQTQQRVTAEAAAIQDAEFEPTTINATTNRTDISFHDPAGVTGNLTTANGTPITDARILIGADGDAVTTHTDANGSFTTTYRPVQASLNASAISITYEPGDNEPYQSASTNAAVQITDQANATITLNRQTDTAAFDDGIQAHGTVRTETASASSARLIDGLPVVLTVEGQRLATATTDAEGRFTLNGSLPASVSAGDVDLQVAGDRQDTAIVGLPVTETLIVESTPTDVSLATEEEDVKEGNLTVSGQLTTDMGVPLASRDISISVGGTDVAVVETDEAGQYTETITIPEITDRNAPVTVTAAFDGAGTNLEASDTTEQISLSGELADRSRLIGLIGLVIVLGVLGVTGYVIRTREQPLASVPVWLPFGSRIQQLASGRDDGVASSSLSSDDQTDGSGDSGTASVATPSVDGSGSPRSPLERARAALDNDQPGTATQIAYATTRSQLTPDATTRSADTHWEFYRHRQDADDIDVGHLQTVTEAYEAAAFAPRGVTGDAAAAAVEATADLVNSGSLQTDKSDK